MGKASAMKKLIGITLTAGMILVLVVLVQGAKILQRIGY
jgi:hypothetical protein